MIKHSQAFFVFFVFLFAKFFLVMHSIGEMSVIVKYYTNYFQLLKNPNAKN